MNPALALFERRRGSADKDDAAPSERLDFNSTGHPFDDSFEAYRGLYRAGSDVARIGDRFEAKVRAWRLPRMLLFDRTLAGLAHERSPRRVRADGFDHVTLQLVIEGRMLTSVDETPCFVGPGGLVAFDMTRPQRTWTLGSRYLTLSMGRELLDGARSLPPSFHGSVVAKPVVLGDVMRFLLRNADALDTGHAAEIAQSISALLAVALGSAAPLPPLILAIAKFERALRFIDANIARPDLSAEAICRAVGVSRSVLYRMFEPFGGVATRIRQRRLDALRAALASPSERRPIGQIARSCGFRTDSHANRAFSQGYGVAPGSFRAMIRDAAAAAGQGEAASRDLHRWLDEVR